MTIKELINHLQELENLHGENCHIFNAESFVSGMQIHTQIRDFEKTYIGFHKDVSDSAGFVFSQFKQGLVIGFVPTVE